MPSVPLCAFRHWHRIEEIQRARPFEFRSPAVVKKGWGQWVNCCVCWGQCFEFCSVGDRKGMLSVKNLSRLSHEVLLRTRMKKSDTEPADLRITWKMPLKRRRWQTVIEVTRAKLSVFANRKDNSSDAAQITCDLWALSDVFCISGTELVKVCGLLRRWREENDHNTGNFNVM